MKRILLFLICSLVAVCVLVTPGGRTQNRLRFKGYTSYRPVKGATKASAQAQVNAPGEIPLWNFSITASPALGGGTFTGTMIGRSPFARGKTTTTINLQIVPLRITINDGASTQVYDPSVVDPCIPIVFPGAPSNASDVSIIQNSPLFTNNSYTMNGVNVGNTQYIDAFQRANFWSLVQGTPYHLILNPTVLPVQNLSFSGSTVGLNQLPGDTGGCGPLGTVDENTYDAAIQGLITGPLAATITPGTFPMFLSQAVVTSSGNPSDPNTPCCALGYHSGFFRGQNIQVYSPFSFDSTGLFGGDVITLSHEVAEAVDDPVITNTSDNATPVWGQVGQVTAPQGQTPSLDNGGCQNNLEVGDPLSPGGPDPPGTNAFMVVGANGFTYHMQELAFFSWFFGGTSLGAGGKYSNNGTFGGAAKPCPPGGTN